MWMLTMGDADCYNKGEQRTGWPQSTPDVISQVADKYVEYDMPRGWILPNDGYGCGYVVPACVNWMWLGLEKAMSLP